MIKHTTIKKITLTHMIIIAVASIAMQHTNRMDAMKSAPEMVAVSQRTAQWSWYKPWTWYRSQSAKPKSEAQHITKPAQQPSAPIAKPDPMQNEDHAWQFKCVNLTDDSECLADQPVVKDVEGDIIAIALEKKPCAIVNAANKDLEYGGGIAGAIIDAESTDTMGTYNTQLRNNAQEQATAVATKTKSGKHRATYTLTNSQGKLAQQGKVQYIIHAVGPDAREDDELKMWRTLLKQAYHETFQEAENLKCKTIVIPALSSSIFGKDKNNNIIITASLSRKYFNEAVRDFAKQKKFNHLETIFWVNFNPNAPKK